MSGTHSNLYNQYLLIVSGLGGLLYGIDIGVIDPALTYLNQSIHLSERELSAVVAAVLAGSIFGSVIAGVAAEWLGRRRMMIASGALFVLSVGIIFLSQSFLPLIAGRLLQGTSGGVIAVVIPLYLAECLPSHMRGRGAAVFQFMLTIGIVLAAIVGRYYVGQAEASIAAAGSRLAEVSAAADHAWRGMFLAVAYPGCLFLIGTVFLPESPRWLVRKNRVVEAQRTLLRMRTGPACAAELADIQASLEKTREQAALPWLDAAREMLTRRRYVWPFILACTILGCSQATGINSILQFMSTILQKAGLDPVSAANYGSAIKVLNSVMTVVAIMLVERKGRVFLLKLGTGGIVVSLSLLALNFYKVESHQLDVRVQVERMVRQDALSLDLAASNFPGVAVADAGQISILYAYGEKQNVAEAFAGAGRIIRIARPAGESGTAPLRILRARIGPVPGQFNGLLAALCIGAFVAFFSVGPGVCVWLALSELMPNRIRSVGMGVALLINQGVATAIALVFLPIVGSHGYYAMFLFWAGCTVIYFITVAWFLPETKGKTLEEIETFFSDGRAGQGWRT